VRRFRRGDSDASERLARTASRLALRTAAAIVGNREEAGDISQDVAVDVLGSLHRLREPEAFEGYNEGGEEIERASLHNEGDGIDIDWDVYGPPSPRVRVECQPGVAGPTPPPHCPG
jgi:hypothetical protein